MGLCINIVKIRFFIRKHIHIIIVDFVTVNEKAAISHMAGVGVSLKTLSYRLLPSKESRDNVVGKPCE